jgi:hypothetical protein
MALFILILVAGGYLLAAGAFASAVHGGRWATIAFYTGVTMVFSGAYLLIANWKVL